MVDGGSTGHLPVGTLPPRPASPGARGPVRPRPEPDPPAPPIVYTLPCRDIAELDVVFDPRDPASHCWCQVDRMPLARFEALDDEERRGLLARELHELPVPGIVARLGDERVGWCSVAPRSRFGRLRGCAATRAPDSAADDPGVWSATCFVVRPGFGHHGVAPALLAGAVDHARSGGAGWLEGYPVEPGARTASSPERHRGTLAMFRAAGFEVVARPCPGRAIVRLEL